MLPIEFLKTELQVIANKFPNITITYGYDMTAETHVVQIVPLFEYDNNSELDEAWIPVSLKFMETFLGEEIAFVSSDSFLEIDEILLEYKANVCIDESAMTAIYYPLTNNEIPPYTFFNQFVAGNLLEGSKDYFLDSTNEQVIDNSDLELPTYSYAA